MHSKFLWTSCLAVQGNTQTVQYIMQFPSIFFFIYHQTENIHDQVQTAFIKKNVWIVSRDDELLYFTMQIWCE